MDDETWKMLQKFPTFFFRASQESRNPNRPRPFIPRLAGHEAGVTALTLQEPLLASGAADNSTKLWDVVSWDQRTRAQSGGTAGGRGLEVIRFFSDWRGGCFPPNHPLKNRVFHYKPVHFFGVPLFFGNTHVFLIKDIIHCYISLPEGLDDNKKFWGASFWRCISYCTVVKGSMASLATPKFGGDLWLSKGPW